MDGIRTVLGMILSQESAGEIRQLLREMQQEAEQADQYRVFCEWFELGDWFYSALVDNEVDLTEVRNMYRG